jgi:creatinine amidohydrolase
LAEEFLQMSGSSAFDSVRYEFLLPHELRAILANRPVVYVPLGTYEWHGEHLPVGLDALTAYGICLRAAARDGGVVMPPLYYGTGGGHAHYPWTIMMASGEEISALLVHTLGRLRDFGFRLAVLFSGHFAPAQLDMIAAIEARWGPAKHSLSVFSIGVNQIESLALNPDHAALFETTILWELHPDRVAVDRLPPASATVEPTGEGDSWSEARHNKSHPLYGVFGPDPRAFDPVRGPKLLQSVVEFLVGAVRARLINQEKN